MPYFAVDDGFGDHPKMLELQRSKHWKGSIALWTLAGAWSAKHLTDGFVPEAMVGRLSGTKHEADALVAAKLWIVVDGGYRFHDWDVHNSTKAEIERKRAQGRERVTKHRSNANATRASNASVTPLQTHYDSVSNEKVTIPQPNPTQPNPKQNGASAGTRASNLAKIAWSKVDAATGGTGQVPASHDQELLALTSQATELAATIPSGDASESLEKWARDFMRGARRRHVAAWIAWCSKLSAAGNLRPVAKLESVAEASARIAAKREAERVVDAAPPPEALRNRFKAGAA